MVTIAEFKGINLITLRLSYNSTAIEFVSVSIIIVYFAEAATHI